MRFRTALLMIVLAAAACGGGDDDTAAASGSDGGSQTTEASGGDSGSGDSGSDDSGSGDSGSDDSGSDEKELEETVAKALAADLGDDSFGITEDQGGCMARGLIDGLGADRVKELEFDKGDTTQNLTAEEADTVIPVFRDCVDFGGLIAEGILEEAGDSISEGSARCVADAMSDLPFVDTALREILTGAGEGNVDSAFEDPETANVVLEAFTNCLTPEELTALGAG